ncbi:electron transfer flavoprotein subunit alpha/FixB family protein [Variovorax sp. DXTD-1]|uniref:electron transfer flavoprotein subunit alpha/FixB family protein n=1 Tax=Variovorax sp. DXTD-1 TaxID=2495592 RepID=UPI000F86EA80|nr:electron transfer flavoprotein subunit alpha/FixB family protein [Variovorax sp. DXTD-1]RST45385.1 electron transfer flavoprotein subunit alpha/FixB family protein [Variovorax sp. DXTD-1]
MTSHAPVPRIDPRRPATVTPAGLRRIVLGSSEGERGTERMTASRLHTPVAKPVRSAGPFTRATMVVTHAEHGALTDAARQAIAAAAILAAIDTEVIVAVLGACHDDVAALGVDRLLALDGFDANRYQPTACVQWLQDLHDAMPPAQWLFADDGADGQLGRRFAVQTGLRLACGVVELGTDVLRVPADTRHDWLCPHAPVMLLAKGVASTRLPFAGQGLRESAPPLPCLPEHGIEDLGVQAGDPQTLALEEADFILAAGNGVSDLPLFHTLAREVGAAVGASRVAVDDGRFARTQQIGATGKTVSASGYLALGISGAVQHLQGIKDCRHVIAVNLDASAPITRRADLTVVEDSAALMQALLGLVRKEKKGQGA